jgi:hypothetical protein
LADADGVTAVSLAVIAVTTSSMLVLVTAPLGGMFALDGLVFLVVGVTVDLARARVRWRRFALPYALSVATATAVAAPFVGWSAGRPDDYGTARNETRRATGMSRRADSGNVAHAQ